MSVRIVLIDSGLHAAHPHVREHADRLRFAGAVALSGVFEPDADGTDSLGHGTAAAAAILDLAPLATLLSMRIFHQKPDCPFEHVLTALEHALRLEPSFINLSLGTPRLDWNAALEDLMTRARGIGVTIVAPASFSGLPSYPGVLEGFTGVIDDPAVSRDQPQYRAVSPGRGFWHASPFPRDLPGLPRNLNLFGASFAAANVTGHLASRRAT